MKHWTQNIQSQ